MPTTLISTTTSLSVRILGRREICGGESICGVGSSISWGGHCRDQRDVISGLLRREEASDWTASLVNPTEKSCLHREIHN